MAPEAVGREAGASEQLQGFFGLLVLGETARDFENEGLVFRIAQSRLVILVEGPIPPRR